MDDFLTAELSRNEIGWGFILSDPIADDLNLEIRKFYSVGRPTRNPENDSVTFIILREQPMPNVFDLSVSTDGENRIFFPPEFARAFGELFNKDGNGNWDFDVKIISNTITGIRFECTEMNEENE